jgi:hypothetical protein
MFAEADCCAAERAPRVHRILVAQPPQARLAEDVPARISLQNMTIILKIEFSVADPHVFGPPGSGSESINQSYGSGFATQSDSRILLSPHKKVRKTFLLAS